MIKWKEVELKGAEGNIRLKVVIGKHVMITMCRICPHAMQPIETNGAEQADHVIQGK